MPGRAATRVGELAAVAAVDGPWRAWLERSALYAACYVFAYSAACTSRRIRYTREFGR